MTECWDPLGLPDVPTLSSLLSHCLTSHSPVSSAMTVSKATVSMTSSQLSTARTSVSLASSQLSMTLKSDGLRITLRSKECFLGTLKNDDKCSCLSQWSLFKRGLGLGKKKLLQRRERVRPSLPQPTENFTVSPKRGIQLHVMLQKIIPNMQVLLGSTSSIPCNTQPRS